MAIVQITQVIDSIKTFPNYTDYQSLGKIAYAEAVKTWLSELLSFQTRLKCKARYSYCETRYCSCERGFSKSALC